jgi:hypothetical protein
MRLNVSRHSRQSVRAKFSCLQRDIAPTFSQDWNRALSLEDITKTANG